MPYKAFKGPVRPLRALLGPQGPYKALKGLIRLLRALQSPQGPYKALECFIRPLKGLKVKGLIKTLNGLIRPLSAS